MQQQQKTNGLGCHYLLKHLWLKSCWYIAVTHLVTSFNGCNVAISIAVSHLLDCQKHVDWLSVHQESNFTQVMDTCISGCIYQYADEIAVWHLPQPWLEKVHVDDINEPAVPLVDFVATGLLTALANLGRFADCTSLSKSCVISSSTLASMFWLLLMFLQSCKRPFWKCSILDLLLESSTFRHNAFSSWSLLSSLPLVCFNSSARCLYQLF